MTATATTKKITLATFKSFVKKNLDNLYIKNLSSFDGMVDGVRNINGATFRKADTSKFDLKHSYTLGLDGIWCVGGSRDYFNAYSGEGFVGIEVYNSCGNFIAAVPAKQ